MPACARCATAFIPPYPSIIYCPVCTDLLFGHGTWSRYWANPISLATGKATITK